MPAAFTTSDNDHIPRFRTHRAHPGVLHIRREIAGLNARKLYFAGFSFRVR